MSYNASKSSTNINNKLLTRTMDWPPSTDCVKPQRNDWCSWLMRWQLHTVRAAKSVSVTDCFIWQTFVRGCNCRIFAWHLCSRSHNSFTVPLATHVICLLVKCRWFVGRRKVELASEDTTVYSRWESDKWSTFVQVPCSHDVKSTRQCPVYVKCISCGDATWLLRHVPAVPTRVTLAHRSVQRRYMHLASFHRNPSSLSWIVTSPAGQDIFLFTE